MPSERYSVEDLAEILERLRERQLHRADQISVNEWGEQIAEIINVETDALERLLGAAVMSVCERLVETVGELTMSDMVAQSFLAGIEYGNELAVKRIAEGWSE